MLDGSLSCGEADPLRRRAGLKRLEPLEGEGEMTPSLVSREGMDLVHDHCLDRSQDRTAPLRGDEEVEALGRRDRERRWALGHGDTGGLRGVTRPDGDCQLREPRDRARLRSP